MDYLKVRADQIQSKQTKEEMARQIAYLEFSIITAIKRPSYSYECLSNMVHGEIDEEAVELYEQMTLNIDETAYEGIGIEKETLKSINEFIKNYFENEDNKSPEMVAAIAELINYLIK